MARTAVAKLSVTIDAIFGVEDLARVLAHDCHKFAEHYEFGADGIRCPCGSFRCPLGPDTKCNDITAADWLRVLEVEDD